MFPTTTHLKSLLIIFFIFNSFQLIQSQVPALTDKRISMLFIGDIMGHDSQIASAENRETHTYNYDEVFRYVEPVISKADVAIANLEVTLAGRPYTGYPQFSSPAELAQACKKAGIDYLVTANNHSADRGKKGIVSTIFKLDSLGIPHTGTYTNIASRDSLAPLMIYRNGLSIALLNYTYGTNGIIVPEPVIVDSLDKSVIIGDIEKAKNKNADVIILFLHWGTEYDTIPGKNQTELAEYFLSNGVNLVIGSHPHVLQKMVWVKDSVNNHNGVIVYSLGNFISNQRKPKTDGGSMVRIDLIKESDGIKIMNAGYYLTWVYTPVENYRTRFFILPCSEFENNRGFFNTEIPYLQMKKFIINSRALLDSQNRGIDEYVFNGYEWVLKD